MPDLLTRGATIQPQTFDPEARTVQVIWSTGAAVPRRDGQGPYAEVLSLDPAHVRLDHLTGASVLNSHQQRDLSNVLGVVTAVGIEAGAGWATVRFSARAEVQPVVEDVRAGVIRHVSVGYSVARWLDARDPATGGRTRTAIDWTPREISFVPLPADPGATVRGHTMDAQNTPENSAESAAEDAANRAEVNRNIRSIATVAGFAPGWADARIDEGATVEQARAAAVEELVRRGGSAVRTHRVEMGFSGDDPAVQLRHMQDALVARMMPTQQPGDAARPYMNLALSDMARRTLELRGERPGMASREELLHRAAVHTMSDFPDLLGGAGRRVLQAAYEAAASPLKTLGRRITLPDFRAKSALRLSDPPKLQRVTEAGEIKYTTRFETKETYALETYAIIFAISRKALVNDDLSAFADWGQTAGRAAAETEADALVQLLTAAAGAGPTMGDGKRLFSPEHGNVAAAGTGLSVAALSEARLALRNQKGQAGAPVNAVPRFLVIGPALETVAEQLLAAIYAQTPEGGNPFAGKLTPLVEPRLPANAWYLFADPAVMPVLEYAHLSSAQGPQVSTKEGWDTLGMEFRCILDFGCGVLDHRGVFRNPGAA